MPTFDYKMGLNIHIVLALEMAFDKAICRDRHDMMLALLLKVVLLRQHNAIRVVDGAFLTFNEQYSPV